MENILISFEENQFPSYNEEEKIWNQVSILIQKEDSSREFKEEQEFFQNFFTQPYQQLTQKNKEENKKYPFSHSLTQSYSQHKKKHQKKYQQTLNSSKKSFHSKNQTKNIPKNYGKAIISFIQKQTQLVNEILKKLGIKYCELIQYLQNRKKSINTIAELREMWLEKTNPKFHKAMRILSNIFLKRFSLNYIFNSRITNYKSHIKYRQKLIQAIQDPENFRNIKDY